MQPVEIFLGLMWVVGAVTWLAPKLKMPSALLLVAVGAAIASIPGVPAFTLDPDAIFLIFVPPIVYFAAFHSSWWELLRHARTIALLAVALVLATVAVVAVVAHVAMPGFGWGVAFVLAAILAPSDATAVLSILKNLRLPRRLESVLEGESLWNDPVAIVSYRVAVAAVVTGSFSPAAACWRLVLVALGGAVVGVVIGWLLYQVRKRLFDAEVEVVASFLSPYAAYLPAEWLGVSGITATLACGMYLGWKMPKATQAETRFQSQGAWSTLLFLLNGFVFLLLGMETPRVVASLPAARLVPLTLSALLITAVIVGVRAIAILGPSLASWLRGRGQPVPMGELMVAAWSGMRGMDSLVTALAIPLVTAGGQPFPQRDAIIFVSAVVIVLTLAAQGFSLPWLVRWFDVQGDGLDDREAAHARVKASQSALDVLKDHAAKASGPLTGHLDRLQSDYERRLRRYEAQRQGSVDPQAEALADAYHAALQDAVEAERRTIIMLRNEGQISNEVMHRIERELDLKETLHQSD